MDLLFNAYTLRDIIATALKEKAENAHLNCAQNTTSLKWVGLLYAQLV
jgi:hypothetical protein